MILVLPTYIHPGSTLSRQRYAMIRVSHIQLDPIRDVEAGLLPYPSIAEDLVSHRIVVRKTPARFGEWIQGPTVPSTVGSRKAEGEAGVWWGGGGVERKHLPCQPA